jgi:hypothetical protein
MVIQATGDPGDMSAWTDGQFLNLSRLLQGRDEGYVISGESDWKQTFTAHLGQVAVVKLKRPGGASFVSRQMLVAHLPNCLILAGGTGTSIEFAAGDRFTEFAGNLLQAITIPRP